MISFQNLYYEAQVILTRISKLNARVPTYVLLLIVSKSLSKIHLQLEDNKTDIIKRQ